MREATRSEAKIRIERVLQRQVEARGSGIALASRTAAQLVVDAAGSVPLGADDMQAPCGIDHLLVAESAKRP
jgi:hypothetical protein